jgi:CRISPR-associated endonuclease/helicase Cas3
MDTRGRTVPDFPSFFHALWGYPPFPWQSMLAERVGRGSWPAALDLPTASGKTACIDVAIHALAAQAGLPVGDRTAPRRIWFVVDRRIVVDEAFERARGVAERLASAQTGPLAEVADRLRLLSGTERPLAVARLRGGVFRDDGWARLPSQPAVITSTVDQLGSRLLFRGYGHSLLAAPIFAGLVANDSLIVLDEAHCAIPFLQTLRAVERCRGQEWAEAPLPAPFGFVVMSATPPPDIPEDAVFPGTERERALDHPELHRRLRHAHKHAEMVKVNRARGAAGDPLVGAAAARAVQHVREGCRRVAVMVNRVLTAERVAAALREAVADEADVVLLTGRIRPFERDGLVERWTPYLRASPEAEPDRPVVVVATQCLEVGADFSFAALVTECASVAALRQRFGRLARLGSERPAPAAILIREEGLDSREPDPIYGGAIAATWQWLWEGAAVEEGDRRVVDFAVEALEAKLRDVEDAASLLAPAPQAPVMLPAHLDLLCQTAPPAHPEPDVSLYLHGRPGPPEAHVVWRCDLIADDPGVWEETVALCPPVSGEMLPVPLWRLRAWLASVSTGDDGGDVEGAGGGGQDGGGEVKPCLVWRGRERSRVTTRASDIAPGDVVVVPAAYGIGGLGQATGAMAVGAERLDLWEPVRDGAGQPAAVRLHRAVLAPWLHSPPLKDLVAQAESPAWDREAVQDAIDAVLDYQPGDEEAAPAPPPWWLVLLRKARGGRMQDHPLGGIVLYARAAGAARATAEPDLFADDDDLASASDREVTLDDHTASVRRAAVKLAQRCLPPALRLPVVEAAAWHDAGKLDRRFQVMLHQGDEVAEASAPAPLAKSAVIPASPARRRAIREASGLPENFRHELLSEQLARRFAPLPGDGQLADLLLHLVASHHGHARPLAPVSADPSPPPVLARFGGVDVRLEASSRVAEPPPHRLDSGLAERFWRLTRRYGWWGLAYLEAIVRLSDWYGSTYVIEPSGQEEG